MRSLRVKIVTYFCALSLAFRKGESWPTEMRGCGLDAHASTAVEKLLYLYDICKFMVAASAV